MLPLLLKAFYWKLLPRHQVDASLQGESKIAGLVVADSRGLCIQAQVGNLGLDPTNKHIRALARKNQLDCLPQSLPRQLSWNQGSNQ